MFSFYREGETDKKEEIEPEPDIQEYLEEAPYALVRLTELKDGKVLVSVSSNVEGLQMFMEANGFEKVKTTPQYSDLSEEKRTQVIQQLLKDF